MPAITAYITAKDREEAIRIGRGLLKERLVACVNVLDGMQSLYWWEGRIEEASECVLIAKTVASMQDRVVAKVKELHGYKVPCIVFWPLAGGNPDYLDWIAKETGHA
ncbi:MAG: cutA [Fibrobacteres bacterium]|nr:cutA [Fibrobacterota bacterium]